MRCTRLHVYPSVKNAPLLRLRSENANRRNTVKIAAHLLMYPEFAE